MRWNPLALCLSLFGACLALASSAPADDISVRYLDQGAAWTPVVRATFYTQDEGSQLIPRAWFEALTQADGTPFLADALQRYGFLPNPANPARLPVGFTQAASAQGDMVGLTCAACHVRQIEAAGTSYRIDGAPAIADFAAFVRDLDDAVRRVLASDAAFAPFAGRVLKAGATDPAVSAKLRGEVALWSQRFHALVAGSLPRTRPWGPTRLDAIAVIYNFLTGLDVGPPPSYLIEANIQTGDAPVRYPFLWNVPRQDFTQWTGVAQMGNAPLELARSLTEIIGVFATFHPKPAVAGAPLDRDYLGATSASVPGILALNKMVTKLAPPAWPFAVDRTLAAQGAAVFARPAKDGGCAECHGIQKGAARPPVTDTWKTPLVDVGTDRAAWRVLLRSAGTGSLQGATIPGAIPPLPARVPSLTLLKTVVGGMLLDFKARNTPSFLASKPATPPEPPKLPPPPSPTNVYEARVLFGIWAAAPYLHNGAVPTLADLLEPAARRPSRFAVGTVYDPARVGLATAQAPSTFVLETTDCADLESGNSRCGHEYGTSLPASDKRALLEYLKTL